MYRSPAFYDVCVYCEENEDKDPSPLPSEVFRSEEEIAEVEPEEEIAEVEPIMENQFVSISNPTELERIESLAAVAYSKRYNVPRQVRQLSEEPDENGNHQLIKLHKSTLEASISVGYKGNGGLEAVIPKNGSISTKVRKGYRWQYVDKVENAKHQMPPLVVVDSNGNLVKEFLDRAMQARRHGLDSALTDDAIAIVARNHDTVLDPCARPPKVLRFKTYVVDQSQADDNGKIPLPRHWHVSASNYFGFPTEKQRMITTISRMAGKKELSSAFTSFSFMTCEVADPSAPTSSAS